MRVKKKEDLEKSQFKLLKRLKHIDLQEMKVLSGLIDEEIKVNDGLRKLIREIVVEEKKVEAVGQKVKDLARPFAPKHSKRNMAIIAVMLVLAVSVYFFQPKGEELSMSRGVPSVGVPEGSLRFITSEDIGSALARPIPVRAKAGFLNSLVMLYYFADENCVGKTCLLDESAVKTLLGDEKSMKSAALSAYQISFKDGTLRILSEKPLSAKLPGSAGQATIFLDNVVWRVSEKDGDFEFNIIEGKAWLEVSAIGGLGNIFKGESAKIEEIPDVRRARLFRYKRDDGSVGLYGVIYGADESLKDGVDLSNEKFSTVNRFPEEEVAVRLGFAR